MKKKFIRLLSVFLTCAAISSTPVMATTGTIKDMKKSVAIGIQNNKNLKTIMKDLQNSEINKNLTKENATSISNNKLSSNATTSSSVSYMSTVPIQNQVVPLTQYSILAYEDNTWQYTAPGHEISRSNLPIDFIAFQAGTSYSLTIKIDGTELGTSSYSYEKDPYQTDDYRRVVSWACYGVINKDFISNLPNGLHTVTVTTSSYNRYTTGGTTITDDFYFYLTD